MDLNKLANEFGCTVEQLKAQYARNAKSLAYMRDKAKSTGKKQNNYTYEQLCEMTTRYEKLAS